MPQTWMTGCFFASLLSSERIDGRERAIEPLNGMPSAKRATRPTQEAYNCGSFAVQHSPGAGGALRPMRQSSLPRTRFRRCASRSPWRSLAGRCRAPNVACPWAFCRIGVLVLNQSNLYDPHGAASILEEGENFSLAEGGERRKCLLPYGPFPQRASVVL
jgi:hypothetical protein